MDDHDDKPEVHRVYLQNEIPKFPSGMRNVTVRKYGHKWVYLECGRKKVRVHKSVWANLVSSTEKFNNRMKLPPKPYRGR